MVHTIEMVLTGVGVGFLAFWILQVLSTDKGCNCDG